jgi:raffinose/stachyose/melibiose transport system substrate-binding protein
MTEVRRLGVGLLAGALLALGLGASEALAARSGQVTISLLGGPGTQFAFDVLIPNFERVYPNITVNVTYAASVAVLQQLETIELASGHGPDVLTTYPGCGNSVSVCVLGPAGYLAPMIKAPTRRALPLVLSLDKYGPALVAFTPQVAPYGVFTNNALFAKLGLKVPQTFPQLLDLCRQAKADGTVALIWAGGNAVELSLLVQDLAVATVYGRDRHWTSKQKAGTVTFAGSAGWHQALQEVNDMNQAGCFQPGVTGTTTGASAALQFAEGRGLMLAGQSSSKGPIDASSPQFSYSFSPFPGGTEPSQTRTLINLTASLSVNARSTTANQAAAQTFIDFIARPKQDALYTELTGGLTQYEFLKKQLPAFMAPSAQVFTDNEYVIAPSRFWWNPNVQLALQTYGIGVITGQSSIDVVLNAMDAAWKQGPS